MGPVLRRRNYFNVYLKDTRTVCRPKWMLSLCQGQVPITCTDSSTNECRCTARLLIRALDEDDQPSDELLSRLCAVFKSGMG